MNCIRQKRLDFLLTQNALALKVGVDRTTIAKWEAGVVLPPTDKLIKLSEIFNCTLDELVKGNEKNKQ